MKKAIIIIGILFVMIPCIRLSALKKPNGVHKNAKWLLKAWFYTDKNGTSTVWNKSGVILSKTITIIPNKKKKIYHFYNNGNFKRIGIEIFIKQIGVFSPGWIAISKWKEYHDNGKLKSEHCYTPILRKIYINYISEKCGTEKIYDRNGNLIKTITHKYNCKYGCE